ncbi:MAG: hypothetical protein JO119_04600 [Acidobacteria bacterium]|nr:hypothetical protein [Acidobacteriota bacterium]
MMKFAAGIVFAGALLGFTANASAQTPPEIEKDTKVVASTETPAPVVAPLGVGTAFNASLDEALDTRHAKAGDAVAAEAAEDVSYQRCVVLPKGTKIIGHIVKVTSGAKGRTGSAIFVTFDKAVMKDGQEIIFNAGIQALAVTAVPESARSTVSEAQAIPVENSESGAANDSFVATNYQQPRAVAAPMAPAVRAQGAFSSDGLFSNDSKGAFGRPDLKVYTPTSEGSHGTVILSSKKILHLDPGTHLLLVVQPPPSDGADGASGNAPEAEQQQ